MLLWYKLLIFFCVLSGTVSLPIITAGITFGTPFYSYRPIATPVYYERPYDYYYNDGHYYDGFSSYPHDYAQHYEYVGGGFGGPYGSLGGYTPFII